MALPPKDSDHETFYREVDDELRREQLVGFFSRFGIAIAAAVLLLVAGVGGYIFWQHRTLVAAEGQSEELNPILEETISGTAKSSDPRLAKLAADGNSAYRAAALLAKADLAVREKNESAAIDGFRTVAEDEDLPAPYRDAALIRQTSIEFDRLPPDKVVERLKHLAVKDNPWFGTAGEMVAVAYLKQKKPDLAAPIFAAIAKDEKVPQSIRARASQMAGALGIDVVPEADVNKEANQ